MTHNLLPKTETSLLRQEYNKTLNPCLYRELKPVTPATAGFLWFLCGSNTGILDDHEVQMQIADWLDLLKYI